MIKYSNYDKLFAKKAMTAIGATPAFGLIGAAAGGLDTLAAGGDDAIPGIAGGAIGGAAGHLAPIGIAELAAKLGHGKGLESIGIPLSLFSSVAGGIGGSEAARALARAIKNSNKAQ